MRAPGGRRQAPARPCAATRARSDGRGAGGSRGDRVRTARSQAPHDRHLRRRGLRSSSSASFPLGFVVGLLDRMRDIFIWILAAAFLAVALNPLVEKLEPKLGRRPAATVVFIGFVIGFIAVATAFVAPFVTQVDQYPDGRAAGDHGCQAQQHDQPPRQAVPHREVRKAASQHAAEGRVRRRRHHSRRRGRRLDRLLPDVVPALRAARILRRGARTRYLPERRPRVVAAAQST